MKYGYKLFKDSESRSGFVPLKTTSELLVQSNVIKKNKFGFAGTKHLQVELIAYEPCQMKTCSIYFSTETEGFPRSFVIFATKLYQRKLLF